MSNNYVCTIDVKNTYKVVKSLNDFITKLFADTINWWILQGRCPIFLKKASLNFCNKNNQLYKKSSLTSIPNDFENAV